MIIFSGKHNVWLDAKYTWPGFWVIAHSEHQNNMKFLETLENWVFHLKTAKNTKMVATWPSSNVQCNVSVCVRTIRYVSFVYVTKIMMSYNKHHCLEFGISMWVCKTNFCTCCTYIQQAWFWNDMNMMWLIMRLNVTNISFFVVPNPCVVFRTMQLVCAWLLKQMRSCFVYVCETYAWKCFT